MPSSLPSIPNIPLDHPDRQHLEPMKETLEVITGSRKVGAKKYNAVPTWQELLDLGLITDDQVPS